MFGLQWLRVLINTDKVENRFERNCCMRKVGFMAMFLAGSMFFSSPYLNCVAQEQVKVEQTTEVVQMIPHLLTSGNTQDLQTVNRYEISPQDYATKEVIIPIIVTNAGIMSCDIYTRKQGSLENSDVDIVSGSCISGGSILGPNGEEQQKVSVAVYKDSACTELVGTTEETDIALEGKQIYSNLFEVQKNSIYYIKLTWNAGEDWIRNHIFLFELQQISSESRTLTKGQYVKSYQNSENSTIYYKVKAPENGVLYAEASYDKESYGKPKITLYNHAKKAISVAAKNDESTEYISAYAVKKGQYYLKVSNVLGAYQFRYTFTPVKNKSGKKKSTARKLLLGKKSALGMITIDDSTKQYDWYKFVLKKPSKVRITLEGSTTGNAKISLEVVPPERATNGNKVVFSSKPIFSISNIHAVKSAKSNVWPAGTWYLRVKKNVKKGSGVYRLKVDKIKK